ncbi:MAG: hypothetical protein H6Q67_836 [Firmicutes bacterium]|nr:hypothetical protein [Bacillota bacterium]
MKRYLSIIAVICVMVMSLSGCAVSGESADVNAKHIKSVTAITEVFGDGQKVTAAAVEYDKDVDNSKLKESTFSVDGRTITKVYANNAAAKTAQGTNGRYVIIELSASDKEAPVFVQEGRTNTRKDVKISLKQVDNVITIDGETYKPDSNVMVNSQIINAVVDDFKQLEYKDPKTGKTLKYNLFVPKNYDKNKSYPLVMFIHDAGTTSDVIDTTLVQGLGGVIWATPSEQEKHECFVLAPQYSTQIVNDNSEATDDLEATVNLINSIVSQYSIDKNRLYATGQSGGCMMSIAMNIKYPDLFAASMLVAGQWDPQAMTVLAKKNMWIVVSEGDERAFPGMNASLAKMEAAGAKISRSTWSGQASAAEFASNARKMIAKDSNIKYTVLKKGTVVPAGQRDDAGSNHINTWRIAYTIEGVRDWLFTQVKATKS